MLQGFHCNRCLGMLSSRWKDCQRDSSAPSPGRPLLAIRLGRHASERRTDTCRGPLRRDGLHAAKSGCRLGTRSREDCIAVLLDVLMPLWVPHAWRGGTLQIRRITACPNAKATYRWKLDLPGCPLWSPVSGVESCGGRSGPGVPARLIQPARGDPTAWVHMYPIGGQQGRSLRRRWVL